MNRVFHRFEKWEDLKAGMYERTCFMDDTRMVQECFELLTCPEWLHEAMVMAAWSWTHSAEHNLTNPARNRQAWLGQAACCLMHGAPEYLTKQAWHLLSDKQQAEANAVADGVIETWSELQERGYFEWLRSASKKMC